MGNYSASLCYWNDFPITDCSQCPISPKFPCKFPIFREFKVETGSHETATSTSLFIDADGRSCHPSSVPPDRRHSRRCRSAACPSANRPVSSGRALLRQSRIRSAFRTFRSACSGIDQDAQDTARIAFVLLERGGDVIERITRGQKGRHIDLARRDQFNRGRHINVGQRARQ